MQLRIEREFQNLIPPLTKEEYHQLEDNIIKEGCIDSLIIWNGTIVDGHNRYEICNQKGIKFDTKEKEFSNSDEVKEWIIKHQFGRRNISTAQRCDLVLKLEDVIKVKAKENQLSTLKQSTVNPKSDERINTNEELAKIAGVGHNTIFQYRVVKQEGTPELQQQVLKNEISINKAYKEIRKPEKRSDAKTIVKEKEEKENISFKKCNKCGMTKPTNEFYEGKAVCTKCCTYLNHNSISDNIKIDGDQIFREITEIGTINKVSHSHIVTEIETIINTFADDIRDYSYKKQAIESLNQEEKQSIKSNLQKAEILINQIKEIMEG